MKKLLFLILILFCMPAFAIDIGDLNNKASCSKFEVSTISDSNYVSLGCFDSFGDAKNALSSGDKNSFVLEKIGDKNYKIVDSKYALLYLSRNKDVNTSIYGSASSNNIIGYMNNYVDYGGTDGVLLDVNVNNKRAKLKISGVVGWIKNNEYSIIPIVFVKSGSYYTVTDSEIKHSYAKDIKLNNSNPITRTLGPKPSMVDKGRYYSYDGNYFYSDYYTMIDDYKSGKYSNSVNKEPYYNYYLYLPHRTKTNYTIDDFEVYIRNVLNKDSSIYGMSMHGKGSALFSSADFFKINEEKYGSNALSMFGLSRNETANGTSEISYLKNNLFGHNAYDKNPGLYASRYINTIHSIRYHAYSYINYGYANIKDTDRYYGSFFGNKNVGMNVKYAADIYWGDKAASYYYSFDKDNGMEDFNFYQLVMNTSAVNVRVSPNTNGRVIYTTPIVNTVYVVCEEVKGSVVDGNDVWYKVLLDYPVDGNGNYLSSSSSYPEYNWNYYGYVHSNYFKKINEAKRNSEGGYNTPNDTLGNLDDLTTEYYFNESRYFGKMLKVNEDTDSYFSSSLLNKRNSLVKDSLVPAVMKVSYSDVSRYLIISDLEKLQFSWIDANKVSDALVDVCFFNQKNSSTISLLDDSLKNVIASVYDSNMIAVTDLMVSSGKTYLKLMFDVTDSIRYGYLDADSSNISFTLNYINHDPVINSSDIIVTVDSDYSLTDGVVCSDHEDGDITNKMLVESNIDIKRVGEYYVKYSVCDSKNSCVDKTNKVIVKDYDIKTGLFMYDSFVYESDNKFRVSGYLGINGVNNVNCKHSLIFINEFDNKEYSFDLDHWVDYPYEMNSSNDKIKYDNSGGWFNSLIDLSSIPNGNYMIMVKVYNNGMTSTSMFTNVGFMPLSRRSGDSRGFYAEVDYATKDVPILFSIRDSLISYDVPVSIDPMYNFINDISLDGSVVNLVGTSHNYGVDMSSDKNVERKIIFENVSDFNRFEFDLGSVTDGDYSVDMAVSDNFDKTRAWFRNKIDISSLPSGNYIIYISNKVDDVTYYGEIIDVSHRDFSIINNDKYQFAGNENIRLRMELSVK